MQYSNSGFALLGLIVERVSGQSFYDYMKKNVLDRAGMKRAAYVDVRSHPADVAVGYAKPEDGEATRCQNWDLIEQHSSPAGGAYASAPDLVAFSRALWGGKLVGPALVRQFTTGQVAMGPQMQYAFGFGVGNDRGTWRHVGHNGGFPGRERRVHDVPRPGDRRRRAREHGRSGRDAGDQARVVSTLTVANLQCAAATAADRDGRRRARWARASERERPGRSRIRGPAGDASAQACRRIVSRTTAGSTRRCVPRGLVERHRPGARDVPRAARGSAYGSHDRGARQRTERDL